MATSKGTKQVYKSAVSGKFVTKKHVQKSPNTTFKQTVKTPKKK
jgi:hypothetical protein